MIIPKYTNHFLLGLFLKHKTINDVLGDSQTLQLEDITYTYGNKTLSVSFGLVTYVWFTNTYGLYYVFEFINEYIDKE